jgi:hypothetical protein
MKKLNLITTLLALLIVLMGCKKNVLLFILHGHPAQITFKQEPIHQAHQDARAHLLQIVLKDRVLCVK